MLASPAAGGEAALDAAAVFARAAGENFPVAPRWLPARWREPLWAIYGYARLVDELGDAAAGDRLALLDAVERELDAAYRGEAQHPVLRRLEPVLRSHALPRAPFVRLIEANRWDQRLRAIQSWEELEAYCALSAQPVGELVLHVFGQAMPDQVALSNHVCSALQVIEHCQDVGEDLARGRIYLPAEDLAAVACTAADLADPSSLPLRRAVALEIARARALLASGRALVRGLRGFARLAVAGYVAGGLAACDALERAVWDASRPAAQRQRRDWLRRGVPLWLGAGA
jgi:squalene synthase HpnC